MKFAFCLFDFIPFGGMQDNLLRIAGECVKRGHQVDLFAHTWQGDFPKGFQVLLLPAHGWTNHGRGKSFAQRFNGIMSERRYNAIVGFNKMPGLDVYYAADTCFAAKALKKGPLYRLTTRYRTYLQLEQAVFHKDSKTHILLLAEREKHIFMDYYDTPQDRFHLLPPGIRRDRLAPSNAPDVRKQLCSELGVASDMNIVLMVGSRFKTKGVDRAIRAIASLLTELGQKTILLIVGNDRPGPYERLAGRLGVTDKVYFVGGRDDVARFLCTADLLLHPAYLENTGTVLIEAMAAGLPVLASDVCGYGPYVERAGAGELIPSPFKQKTLNKMLASMLVSEKKTHWQKNGKGYVANTDVFSRPEKAADIIERVATC